ncbi:MAG: hypothetical protein J4F36_11380 [Nitrosopumilaceae archaeon]|nr:hypothetical protein [Nitrosopumilaceae archaeon]
MDFLKYTLLVLFSIPIFFSYADNTVFSKDLGEELSQDECQKRHDLFGMYYEPIMDLAKLKIETHSAFKKVVNDDSYQIISTSLRSSPYSENCKMDLPSFGIHYATNMTDSSYTRIYVNLERVSYDVHEITTRIIDYPWIDRLQSGQLPFYVTDWDMVHMLGEYPNSEPPKPSQTFKIPYLANNGRVNHIETDYGMITADVSMRDGGIFALKIPRNYPYSDHDDSVHPGHGFLPFVITSEPGEEVFAHVTKTDCYYDVWMHVSGNKTVELSATFSYLQGDPMHGDADVPEFCIIKTIADDDTAYLTELSPHKQVKEGISPYLVFCKDGLYFLLKHDGSPACVSYNTQTALWNRGWTDKSTDIYTKYATAQILDEFNSKLLSEKEALKVVKKFINKTNLVLDVSLTNPDFVVTSSLVYVPSQTHAMLSVDPLTGLPTQIVSAELEGFYRTPNWYAELQKDYLGMPSQRIENGNVAWEISYRTCSMCHDYATFLVDAITGKVINTYNIDKLFHIST